MEHSNVINSDVPGSILMVILASNNLMSYFPPQIRMIHNLTSSIFKYLINITCSFFKRFNVSSCFPYRFTRPRPPLWRVSPFRAQFVYLLFISFIGYLALRTTSLRGNLTGTHLGSLDAAFMSISAVTSSSMSTVEMEAFTNTQLILFIFLMLLGGEVFVSMLGLFLQAKLETLSAVSPAIGGGGVGSSREIFPNSNPSNVAELGFCTSITTPTTPASDSKMDYCDQLDNLNFSKITVIKALTYLVLAYLFLIHFWGSLFVYIYVITVPNAAQVLKSKMIRPGTFSIFLTASSFANCGFVPTNENMAVFKDKSLLLLLVIPQILMGNTFYPICLQILIRVMEFLTKNKLYTQILSNTSSGYNHLLSGRATKWLGWTGLAFVLTQMVMLTGMEWASDALTGMNWFQKMVALLFEAVNSRHSGESVLDLSTLPPAILVLFTLMMYFPPYFTFMPTEEDEAYKNPAEDLRSIESADTRNNNNNKLIVEDLIFSKVAYLAVFVILVSVTERKRLKDDPLNFNVLNIVIEVISAYGNVGFSMGYSCKRQIKPTNVCEDKTYGFAGRWSSEGKLILIVVMIFGKLKKFNHKGGKAWKTL